MMHIRRPRAPHTLVPITRFAATLLPMQALLLALIATPGTAQQRTDTGAPQVLTLTDAITLATRTSESVALARAGELRARGQAVQARSQMLPQVNTSLAWQKQLQNQFQEISKRLSSGEDSGGGDSSLASNPLTRIFASPYNATFTLQAQQNVFTGGRVTAQNRAAAFGRDAAAIGTTSATAQVQLDVTQAYFDALLADRLVAIAESSLVQSERTLRQVQLTRQVGSASEFEFIRARVTRDNMRPQFLQARTQRDLTMMRLKQLLDLPLDRPLTLVEQAIEAPDFTPVNAAVTPAANATITTVQVDATSLLAPDPAVKQAVDRAVAAADTIVDDRSSVRQARLAVDIAKQQYRATRAQRLPTLGLVTTYQRLAYPSDGLPNSLADFFPNWTAGFQVSFPLFTGGRVRGEELAAEAGVIEAEQRLRQTREGAALDVRQAVAQYEEAFANWQASLGTDEQATRAYQIAEVRFREGISTQLELAETRNQLQQAQANRARAMRDVQVARVRLQLLKDLPLGAGAAGGMGTTNGAGTFTAPPAGQQQQQQGMQRAGNNTPGNNP